MGEVHTTGDKVEFFRRVFGGVEQGARDNIQVKCPYCVQDYQDGKRLDPPRSKKLAIATEKNDVWHCWSCSRKGHIIKVLRSHASHDHYQEYINRFADDNMIRIHSENEEAEGGEYVAPSLPADFKMLAVHRKSSYAKQAIRYLKERGATERDLWYFKFGISGEWPWENRVIMPSFDEQGSLNYYCGRAMEPQPVFKYWDSEFRKRHIIFNELNIDWTKELTITEGIFDLIKCNDNAVPLLGSTLSDESRLYEMIVTHQTPVLLALDADIRDTKLPWIIRIIRKAGIRVRVLDMVGYDDVGDMPIDTFNERREQAEVWTEATVLKDKIQRKIRTQQIV